MPAGSTGPKATRSKKVSPKARRIRRSGGTGPDGRLLSRVEIEHAKSEATMLKIKLASKLQQGLPHYDPMAGIDELATVSIHAFASHAEN